MKLPTLTTDITLFEKVTLLELLTFTKHISLMLKSGIALPEAVSILEKQTPNKAFKKLLVKIQHEVANGQPLHKAIAKFPKVFDPFYINLVRAAEESGTLEQNLAYLSNHIKKQRAFGNKVKGALLYPSIVLSVAGIAGLGLSVFVLPKLVDLFSSLDVELPLSTKILLGFAQLMKDHGLILLVGVVLAYAGARFLISTKRCKPAWQRFLLSLPFFGIFLQNIELASLFRNVGTMLGVGVPISNALDVQIDTTANTVYKDYLTHIRAGIGKGKPIEEILSAKSMKFMPLIAVRMIGVGEKTGRLDETLMYLGEYFEEEVDDASKNLSTILEPIILVIVGLIVAFIALAIIGPIYQFTGSIKR